jgi:hypothetical protein
MAETFEAVVPAGFDSFLVLEDALGVLEERSERFRNGIGTI